MAGKLNSFRTSQDIQVGALSILGFGLNISDSVWSCYTLPVTKMCTILELTL
jgi:hypothetical protein